MICEQNHYNEYQTQTTTEASMEDMESEALSI